MRLKLNKPARITSIWTHALSLTLTHPCSSPAKLQLSTPGKAHFSHSEIKTRKEKKRRRRKKGFPFHGVWCPLGTKPVFNPLCVQSKLSLPWRIRMRWQYCSASSICLLFNSKVLLISWIKYTKFNPNPMEKAENLIINLLNWNLVHFWRGETMGLRTLAHTRTPPCAHVTDGWHKFYSNKSSLLKLAMQLARAR